MLMTMNKLYFILSKKCKKILLTVLNSNDIRYCNACTKVTKLTSYQGRKRPEGAAEAHGASNPGMLTTKLTQ
jgi:hypothetical protein